VEKVVKGKRELKKMGKMGRCKGIYSALNSSDFSTNAFRL
jgi:hypothetical protein